MTNDMTDEPKRQEARRKFRINSELLPLAPPPDWKKQIKEFRHRLADANGMLHDIMLHDVKKERDDLQAKLDSSKHDIEQWEELRKDNQDFILEFVNLNAEVERLTSELASSNATLDEYEEILRKAAEADCSDEFREVVAELASLKKWRPACFGYGPNAPCETTDWVHQPKECKNCPAHKRNRKHPDNDKEE